MDAMTDERASCVARTVIEGLKYMPSHEWTKVEGDIATVGITDYAAEKLGDVVFVELPTVDSGVSAGQVCGVDLTPLDDARLS